MNAGILAGSEIQREVEAGNIRIEPGYKQEYLNPASYDLTLGSKVAVYTSQIRFGLLEECKPYRRDSCVDEAMVVNRYAALDSRKKHDVLEYEMSKVDGWLLKPGIGYLMHTAERIWTKKFVPVLDGKSSLGRLFITAHVTAGYGDPGFDGQYTLEVVVTHPVRIYPGMRFCQIRFHTLVGEADYKEKGHYVGAAAEGPVPSMSWKQFEEQSREE